MLDVSREQQASVMSSLQSPELNPVPGPVLLKFGR